MRRVVFDCNVYIQALININGPAGRCVKYALAGRILLYLSPQVISEIRQAPQKRTPARLGVTDIQVDQLLKGLLQTATFISDVPQFFTYDRDPDDAHYINLALAAHAQLIVSRDRDLLDLMKIDQYPSAVAFHHQFPELQILDPVTFLTELQTSK